MNSTKSSQHSEAGMIFTPVLIIGGVAGLWAILKWLRQERSFPSGPPPIIVKSGSFEIESSDELDQSGGSGANPFIYTGKDFGEILWVRVFVINERSGHSYSVPFEDSSGLEVDIRLEEYVSGTWQSIGLTTIRSENTTGTSKKDFVLRIHKDLDKGGKAKPPRKNKRRDEGNEPIRFKEVVVRKPGVWDRPFPANEGDEFTITFYNDPA
jgi:hypothetical protein